MDWPITRASLSDRLTVRLAPVVASGVAICLLVVCVTIDRGLAHNGGHYPNIPGVRNLQDWIHPSVTNFNNSVVGYVILLAASALFAYFGVKAGLPQGLRTETPSSPTGHAQTAPIVLSLAVSVAIWAYLVASIRAGEYRAYFPYLVLLGSILPLPTLIRSDLRLGIDFRVNVTKAEVLLLAALMLGCGVVLSYRLGSVPASMWGDEGAFWERASSLAAGKGPRDFFMAGVYGFPLASSFFQSVFVKAFGESVWSWRFSSVIATMLALPPLYFLVRSTFDRLTGFVCVIVVVALPYTLAFSRLGYNNSQALFPITMAALLIKLGVDKKSLALFYLAGAVSGLGLYTYFADRVILFVIPAFILFAVVTKRLSARDGTWGMSLVIAGAVLVGAFPSLYNIVHSDPGVNKKVFEGFIGNKFYVQAVLPNVNLDSYRSTHIAGVTILLDPALWLRLLTRGLFRTALAFNRTDLVEQHYISGSLGGPFFSALLSTRPFPYGCNGEAVHGIGTVTDLGLARFPHTRHVQRIPTTTNAPSGGHTCDGRGRRDCVGKLRSPHRKSRSVSKEGTCGWSPAGSNRTHGATCG